MLFSNSRWPSAEGREMPLVRPSELIPEASATARTGYRRATAVSNLASTMAKAPSARTYPSAGAENGRQSPVGDSIEAREKPMNEVGDISRLTLATIAISIRPEEIADCASANATSDDEQAVSTVKLGPRRSKI